MAFVPPRDRVLEQSTSNSQSVFAVTGALDLSYNAFSASMSVGDTTIGAVVEPGVAFKSGVLTYSATNQVTVTTVFESKGTFSSSGVKQVFMGMPAASALGLDGPQALSASRKAQGRANLDVTKKNYILNGGMQISQQNGTTAGTTSGYYAADQFYVTGSNAGALTFGQVASATPGGSPNRIRLTVTIADASVGSADYQTVVQKIEGRRCADLLFGSASAKAITIQFGVKAPAGTYCVAVVNGSINRSYTAEFTIAGGEANTDVVKSVTIPGDTSGTWATDNTIGLEVRWCLMTGSALQQAAGAWGAANSLGSANQFNLMGTNGNVFELFDVGLYEGNAAPSFQLPDFDDDLRKCKRYWRKSYELGTAPAAATTAGLVACGMNDSAATGAAAIIFDVPMRAAPTIAYWDGNGNASKISYPTSNTSTWNHNTTMIAPFNASQNGFTTSGPNAIPDVQGFFHYTADARL